MLERLRGKRLVFVGDSLNRNMWESLICILTNSVKDKSKVFEVSGRRQFKAEGSYSFLFQVDIPNPVFVISTSASFSNKFLCAKRLAFYRTTIAPWSSSAPLSLFRNGRCQSEMERVPGKLSGLT